MNNKVKGLIIAGACCAVVAVGTLAYFSSVTDTKENIFTIGSGIKGDIDEPNWKPNVPNPDDPDNPMVEYAPGSNVAKDPQILNKSEKESAYVAMKLTYKLPSTAYQTYNENNKTNYTSNAEVLEALGYESEDAYIKMLTADTKYNLNLADITATAPTAEGNWVAMNDVANGYMYVGADGNAMKLAAGSKTEPIFEAVDVVKSIEIKDMMPFIIDAQGFLVQTSNGVDAAVELANLMNK